MIIYTRIFAAVIGEYIYLFLFIIHGTVIMRDL